MNSNLAWIDTCLLFCILNSNFPKPNKKEKERMEKVEAYLSVGS